MTASVSPWQDLLTQLGNGGDMYGSLGDVKAQEDADTAATANTEAQAQGGTVAGVMSNNGSAGNILSGPDKGWIQAGTTTPAQLNIPPSQIQQAIKDGNVRYSANGGLEFNSAILKNPSIVSPLVGLLAFAAIVATAGGASALAGLGAGAEGAGSAGSFLADGSFVGPDGMTYLANGSVVNTATGTTAFDATAGSGAVGGTGAGTSASTANAFGGPSQVGVNTGLGNVGPGAFNPTDPVPGLNVTQPGLYNGVPNAGSIGSGALAGGGSDAFNTFPTDPATGLPVDPNTGIPLSGQTPVMPGQGSPGSAPPTGGSAPTGTTPGTSTNTNTGTNGTSSNGQTLSSLASLYTAYQNQQNYQQLYGDIQGNLAQYKPVNALGIQQETAMMQPGYDGSKDPNNAQLQYILNNDVNSINATGASKGMSPLGLDAAVSQRVTGDTNTYYNSAFNNAATLATQGPSAGTADMYKAAGTALGGLTTQNNQLGSAAGATLQNLGTNAAVNGATNAVTNGITSAAQGVGNWFNSMFGGGS